MVYEPVHRETPQGVVALAFAKALAEEDFSRAWEMLSKKLRDEMSEEDLGARYQHMIADSGWEGPARIVDVTFTLDEYWDQQEDDIGWASVTIAGDHYDEGVTVIVVNEQGSARIRWKE